MQNFSSVFFGHHLLFCSIFEQFLCIYPWPSLNICKKWIKCIQLARFFRPTIVANQRSGQFFHLTRPQVWNLFQIICQSFTDTWQIMRHLLCKNWRIMIMDVQNKQAILLKKFSFRYRWNEQKVQKQTPAHFTFEDWKATVTGFMCFHPIDGKKQSITIWEFKPWTLLEKFGSKLEICSAAYMLHMFHDHCEEVDGLYQKAYQKKKLDFNGNLDFSWIRKRSI